MREFEFLKRRINLLNYADFMKMNNENTKRALGMKQIMRKLTNQDRSFVNEEKQTVQRKLTGFFKKYVEEQPKVGKSDVFQALKRETLKQCKLRNLLIKKYEKLYPETDPHNILNHEGINSNHGLIKMCLAHWRAINSNASAKKHKPNSELHLLLKKNKKK